MNKVFHQLVPLIALKFMPQSFRNFLISDGYTEENIKTDSDLPDEVDKDNLTQDAEIHHAHSYKLVEKDGELHYLDGDCLERLKGLCADAHDFKLEKRFDDLRYVLSKMTHYRVDALTYPHLHKGKPWSKYHTKFEDEMGKFIEKHKDEIMEITFEPYKDIYKNCRTTALNMWYKGRDAVQRLEKGEELTDEEKMEICKICVNEIGDLWTTLLKEFKL